MIHTAFVKILSGFSSPSNFEILVLVGSIMSSPCNKRVLSDASYQNLSLKINFHVKYFEQEK